MPKIDASYNLILHYLVTDQPIRAPTEKLIAIPPTTKLGVCHQAEPVGVAGFDSLSMIKLLFSASSTLQVCSSINPAAILV